MTLRRSLAGMLLAPLLWTAAPAMASAQSMFDLFFEQAVVYTQEPPIPDDKLKEFVIREMETWRGPGILLFPSDIDAALLGDTDVLCRDKLTFQTMDPMLFSSGGLTKGVGCDGLIAAITSLVKTELEIQNLGDVLVSVANGGELATSDQPNRPANVGFATLLTTRVWTATGTNILPWPDAANDTIEQRLNRELAEDGSTPQNMDAIMWKYQHGYFRYEREGDTKLATVDVDFDGDGTTVGTILRELAGILRIASNDYDERGEFVVPKLTKENVGLWARADDLGIMWVYPDHFMREPEIKPAGDYPEYYEHGDQIAYPWTYEGSTDPVDEIKSPVCSRSAGQLGYLCRNVQEPVDNCDEADNDADLNLIRCDEQERITLDGPELCPEIIALFVDDGVNPLWDPNDPRFINPTLQEADKAKICAPENKVMYKDEILGHACYTAFCVAQSHSGHTLVSNRSPNLVSEATSPYLACMRQDPHLGLYAEIAQMTPFALPSYIGHHLAQEYEREYCAITGLPPHPIAGYCKYNENRRINSPLYSIGATVNSTEDELIAVRADQEVFLGDAVAVGQRMALDQWLPVQRKMVATMAQSIQETATLLRELAKAPLTKTPCPWTGPFPRSASSSAP